MGTDGDLYSLKSLRLAAVGSGYFHFQDFLDFLDFLDFQDFRTIKITDSEFKKKAFYESLFSICII